MKIKKIDYSVACLWLCRAYEFTSLPCRLKVHFTRPVGLRPHREGGNSHASEIDLKFFTISFARRNFRRF